MKRINTLVSNVFETNTGSKFEELFKEKKNKKLSRNSSNLPLSAFNAKSWCHLFSNLYKEIYGKVYENYPIKLSEEAITISNIVYPYAFDELEYSAREFAKFLRTYLQVRHNVKKDLVAMMLKTEASFSKMNYYIKKYRRIRKSDEFESLVYIKHNPLTNDVDDLRLILESSNLNSIQMLSNYGIPIYHRYLMNTVPCSFQDALVIVKKTMLNDILVRFRDNEALASKIIAITIRNSILWEPYSNKDYDKGIKCSEFYFLNWRKEFENFWLKLKLNELEWWKDENYSNSLQPIPTVCKFFSEKI